MRLCSSSRRRTTRCARRSTRRACTVRGGRMPGRWGSRATLSASWRRLWCRADAYSSMCPQPLRALCPRNARTRRLQRCSTTCCRPLCAHPSLMRSSRAACAALWRPSCALQRAPAAGICARRLSRAVESSSPPSPSSFSGRRLHLLGAQLTRHARTQCRPRRSRPQRRTTARCPRPRRSRRANRLLRASPRRRARRPRWRPPPRRRRASKQSRPPSTFRQFASARPPTTVRTAAAACRTAAAAANEGHRFQGARTTAALSTRRTRGNSLSV